MTISAKELEQKQRASSRRVVYPERDGKPMGETDAHVQAIADAIKELQWFFRKRDDLYIAGNNFIYYEEGNPRARVSPDTYVVFNIPKGVRGTYFTWKNENQTPDVVIEFTSADTKGEDHGRKKDLYERRLAVSEYFIFDPRSAYQVPRLRGFRLQGGVYVEIGPTEGRLRSEQLGLELVEVGGRLRFFDPVVGRWLPTTEEETQRAEEEARRAEEEKRRADAAATRAEQAEKETERLRAELETIKRRLNG